VNYPNGEIHFLKVFKLLLYKDIVYALDELKAFFTIRERIG
jgi:hypothetical protein